MRQLDYLALQVEFAKQNYNRVLDLITKKYQFRLCTEVTLDAGEQQLLGLLRREVENAEQRLQEQAKREAMEAQADLGLLPGDARAWRGEGPQPVQPSEGSPDRPEGDR